MRGSVAGRVWRYGALVGILVAASVGLLILPAATALEHASPTTANRAVLSGTTLVASPPSGAKGPDDITRLAVDGLDSGRGLIWTAYQNGINPNGTPGSPGGPTHSTVAGYDPVTGSLVRTISITGKVDGLTADRDLGRLIATVNEDSNSALNVINPANGHVTTYAYSPSPAVSGNGGTDSIAVHGDRIFLVHSNPNDATQAADFEVHLHHATLTATLTPVFFDDSSATDAVTGSTVTLALTDPDTNLIMPRGGERFAGDLATVSQADGKIVFASHLHGVASLTVLGMTDNKSGNVPPIDGMAVASSDEGTLYVVDAKAQTIQAFDTSGWAKGTVFVGEPSDTGNPLLGVLDLHTGVITPFANHFLSPKGLLFVPTHSDGDSDHSSGHSHDRGDDAPSLSSQLRALGRSV